MIKLIFIANDLMTKEIQNRTKIPMSFISFAYMEGCLFKFCDKIIRTRVRWYSLPLDRTFRPMYKRGRVYGAIFSIQDSQYYIDRLDAYHACSLSRMGVNHDKDIAHRVRRMVTPIHFDSLYDFGIRNYTESRVVPLECYMANTLHPTVSHKVFSEKNLDKYKHHHGVDIRSFVQAYKEEVIACQENLKNTT